MAKLTSTVCSRAAAHLAKAWSVAMRIVSFTVRRVSGGGPVGSAEDLVVNQWAQRLQDEIVMQLNTVRDSMEVPDVDIVIGSGYTGGKPWRASRGNRATSWRSGPEPPA